jgi:SAM-dependent methyltransferase
MGLLNPVCEFLVKEHKVRPLGPKVLFISRQTVPLTIDSLHKLLARHDLHDQNTGPVEYDDDTRGAKGKRYVSDRYFMQALGIKEFHALDVTAYEGADIAWDLGEPIPLEYCGKYDFIYNGGCFDNMFNPGVALMNLSRLLRLGGRMICMESAASYNSPYLMFSPGWFYDYYVSNNYDWCSVYLATYRTSDQLMHGPWDMQYVNVPAEPNGRSPEALYGNHLLLLVLAQKGNDSTDTIQPVQCQYRTTAQLKDTFARNEAALRQRAHSLIDGQRVPLTSAPYLIDVGKLGIDLGGQGLWSRAVGLFLRICKRVLRIRL